MKTFIADIIPKLQRYSEKLDNLTLLTNQHWVVVDEITNSKTVYIFRSNKELLISKNGVVDKAQWDYLGNNALLLDLKDVSYLFRHGFFDDSVLALKVDGKAEYAFLVNETKYGKELNSIENIVNFLTQKYLVQNQYVEINSEVRIPISSPGINLPEPDKEVIPINDPISEKDELKRRIANAQNDNRVNGSV